MPRDTTYPYTQYTGIWKLNAASAAQGAGTWPTPPVPHLYAWGVNNLGALGTGNTTYYSSPKQIGSLTTWNTISTGIHTLSVKTDGTLWAWGSNGSGSLGLGNTTNYSSPKQVGALTNWATAIANGYYASFAIKTDGSLWSWGNNNVGQLGLGTSGSYTQSPAQVGSLTNWAYVSGGVFNTFAIKTDGSLWTWGTSQGDYGQAGTGTAAFAQSSPVQVGALTNWLQISSAQYNTAAVKTDGTLWTWGRNNFGQLGLSNTTDYSSPKQVGSLTNWLNVACIYNTVLAIKTNGTIWSWGKNNIGQLGNGNTTNYSSPIQIGALTNWSKVSTSYAGTSLAIKTDGTLWAWGQNTYGQLGNGNTTSVSSPVQVGALTSWLAISCLRNSSLGIART